MKQPNDKKETNAQLKKRIERAIVHVDRTKDTSEIFFSDKGLRLVVNDDAAIIGTGYHDHVFQPHTSSGVSRPYIYIKRFIELAKENDCVATDASGNKFYSYQKLMSVLKDKGADNADYLVAYYVDLWLENCFNPLFTIGENEGYAFLVFVDYMHNIAKNAIFLDEHKDGLTNKQFIEKYIGHIREFADGLDERVIFEPKTDEQVMRENIEAIQAEESEQYMVEQTKNEEQKND